VDYYEASGVGLDHYAQVLHDKRTEHRWRYGGHYMPHDIKHRELTTGRSRLQALTALGIDPIVVPEASVLDGSTSCGGCLVVPGLTSIDASEASRHYASIAVNTTID
jgi:hypothetical protein